MNADNTDFYCYKTVSLREKFKQNFVLKFYKNIRPQERTPNHILLPSLFTFNCPLSIVNFQLLNKHRLSTFGNFQKCRHAKCVFHLVDKIGLLEPQNVHRHLANV